MEIKEPCLFAFGDSVGRGVIYDETEQHYQPSENGFLPLLEREDGLSVNNFTRYGYTVEKGYRMLTKQQAKLKCGDLVLLEFGGNDCDFDWAAIAAEPSGVFEAKTPLPQFLTVYERMIRELLALETRPILLNLPPIEPHRYCRHISRDINANNILTWLGGDANYIYRWHEMYSVALTSLGASLGVPVIDIRTPFLKEIHYGDFLCADGIHPNEKGQFLIYQAVRRPLLSQ